MSLNQINIESIIVGSNSMVDLGSIGERIANLPFATVCVVYWGLPLFL